MIRNRHIRRLWQLTAIVLMLEMIVAQVMAANALFHKECHNDADDPAHECMVTLMMDGGICNVMPDIIPVKVTSEPPLGAMPAPKSVNDVSSHLVGGVLAHAPPRGP